MVWGLTKRLDKCLAREDTKYTNMVFLVSIPKGHLPQRILETSLQLFLERGFSKVTVDELAYSLGISKRTLYEHFRSKHQLIRQALLHKVEMISAALEEIIERDIPFPQKVSQVLTFMLHTLPRPSPVFLEDISRKAPEIWEEVSQARTRALQRHFGQLFREGRSEGFFRDGMSEQLVGLMFSTLVEHVITPQSVADLSLSPGELLDRPLDLLMRGVLSEQGKQRYEKELAMTSEAGEDDDEHRKN